MQIWWDIYEKHEKDLDNFELADDDDEDIIAELEETANGTGEEEGGTDSNEELADKPTSGPKKKKGKRGKNKKESNKTLL